MVVFNVSLENEKILKECIIKVLYDVGVERFVNNINEEIIEKGSMFFIGEC